MKSTVPKFVPMNPNIRIPSAPRKAQTHDLTPREVALLHRPNIQELIQRLQCDVMPSVNLRRADAIQHRIDQWLDQAAKAPNLPQVELSGLHESIGSSILDFVAQNARIEKFQIAFHGPRPWAYPLQTCPF